MGKLGIVQARSPVTKHYIKIDEQRGKIISYKKSAGPYKNIPIVGKHIIYASRQKGGQE